MPQQQAETRGRTYSIGQQADNAVPARGRAGSFGQWQQVSSPGLQQFSSPGLTVEIDSRPRTYSGGCWQQNVPAGRARTYSGAPGGGFASDNMFGNAAPFVVDYEPAEYYRKETFGAGKNEYTTFAVPKKLT